MARMDKSGMDPDADRRTAVVIAAYNAEATLERAVRSALAQPDTAEVCIVDDGSVDATGALAQELAGSDRRIQLIAMDANSGPGAARNRAIDATCSPWIAILDADDYMLPGRLAALHQEAEDADFIADALLRTTGPPPTEPPSQPFKVRPLSFEEFVAGNLGRIRGPLDLGFLKPMFRRDFVERGRLRYREDMRLGEDYEFYARALALGARFRVGDPAGYVSVERPGSLSKDHSIDDLRRLRDCDISLSAVRACSSAERRALKRHWNSVDCRLQWRRLIEAVKARNAAAALSTFRSPETAMFLTARLAEQVWLRGSAALRGAPAAQDSAGANV